MSEPPKPWDGLSPDEHERQYNPQCSVPNFKDFQAQREAPNREAKRELRAVPDIAYGAATLRKLDLYLAPDSGAPVHMFLHGGYWRAQDKANFAFVARHLVARGVTAAIVNYELCPAATLDGVVDCAIEATAWLARHVAGHGGDPARITLSGHSAGAHLGAAILATDWPARGLPADIVKGAVLISGIYDPTPAAATSVNADIRLTPEIARRQNYEAHPPRVRCPTWIIAGGREPWHWIDQSWRYARHLHAHGWDPGVVVTPGFHHFDIMNQYMDPESDVLRCVLALAAPRR